MSSILRMKALIHRPSSLATFSLHRRLPNKPNSIPPLLSVFLSSKSIPLLQSSNIYSLGHKLCPIKPSSRCLHRMGPPRSASPGEIHVIVGPMFAGKTTSLLRRIELESNNGSLQVDHPKNIFLLGRTLRGLCYSGRLTEAVRLLCNTGFEIDPATYALILQECIYNKAYKKGRIVHAQMVVVGHMPSEYLKTKLLILYAKLGDLQTAEILFGKLCVKCLVSWNTMITGYVQKGALEIGLDLYLEMRCNGLTPDQYTFASVFRACASLATLENGKRAHCVMIKSCIKENVVVSSALVDMYFKCSSLSDGHRAFDESLERNVVTWTALISGYGQHGKVAEVLNSFHMMIDEDFQPNYVTFLAVLSACGHGGLVDEGWRYFTSMSTDYGIQPRGQHYAAMVDLLGRAGRLGDAYELVLKSPYNEHSVIWGALLGACRTHGHIDLLKLAARKYFELEPENAGKYIVLANGYATFGLWDNVAEVREVVKITGLVKEPAYSRIEVKEKVHFFHKGDHSHEKAEEICSMVREMACLLKDVGFIPELIAE